MHLLYFSLSLLLIGLVYVVLQKMEFFATNNSKVATLEHLQTEVMNLRKGQETANKKLQSLNTRIKYGQIKSGYKSTPHVMPFSRETMESTPFFSIIRTGIYDNISDDEDASPTACQADEILDSSHRRVVEITSDCDLGPNRNSDEINGKVLLEDKTSHNIHSEHSEFSDSESLPSLGDMNCDNNVNMDEIRHRLPPLLSESNSLTPSNVPDKTKQLDRDIDTEIIEESESRPVEDNDIVDESSEVASLKTENLVLKGASVKKPLLKVKINH